MAVETLDDYNYQASCCCPQALCPIPEEDCRSVTATAYAIGSYEGAPPPDNDPDPVYKTVRSDYAGGGWKTDTREPILDVFIDGARISDEPVFTHAEADPRTGAVTISYVDPLTRADALTDALALLAAEVPAALDAATSGVCESSFADRVYIGIEPAFYSILDSTYVRTRFRIPNEFSYDGISSVPFTGTYLLITYDILEEPAGWDDPTPSVFRSFVSEDNVALWTSDGSAPSDPDDAYWFTDWIDLDPPTSNGTRRIVNKRLVCREDWGLGVLPQVWGEAVTLPD